MSNKIKRIIGFLLLFILLVIIKLFLGGRYLDHFWEELIPELIVLFIINFILMIIPLVFRLINKKRIDNKKGKIICFFNSFILFILLSIPNFLTIISNKNNNDTVSLDPVYFAKSLIIVYFIIAIIYYFINMCFFVDNKKKNI